MATHKWSELRNKLSPERRARLDKEIANKVNELRTTDSEVIQLIGICSRMSEYGFSDSFVADVIRLGAEERGMFHLALFWEEADEVEEKDKCIDDLVQLIAEDKNFRAAKDLID